MKAQAEAWMVMAMAVAVLGLLVAMAGVLVTEMQPATETMEVVR